MTARDSGRIAALLAVPIALTTAGFLLFMGYRTDYAGHHVAGAGGTLLLLAPISAMRLPHRDRWVLGAVVVAVGIGAWTEATIFRLAIFDGVDFINQSLGAVVAGISHADGRRSMVRAILSVPVGLLLVVGGFELAFR